VGSTVTNVRVALGALAFVDMARCQAI